MKIIARFFLVVAVTVLASCAAPETEPERPPPPADGMPLHNYEIRPLWVPGQVIVKPTPESMPTSSTAAPAASAGSSVGLGIRDPNQVGIFGVDLIGDPVELSGGEFLLTFDVPPNPGPVDQTPDDPTIDLVFKFRNHPDVLYAHPNYIVELATDPDDPLYKGPDAIADGQWHFFNNGTDVDESQGGINLPDAWDIEAGNAAVVIAVIDTGIASAEEDFVPGRAAASNLGAGYDMITSIESAGDGDGRDANPEDVGDGTTVGECTVDEGWESPDSWHGTHIAGIAGAVQTNNTTGIAGSNFSVTVLPVRALGRCGGTLADVADAIRWSAGIDIGDEPVNAQPAQIINMSLRFNEPCSNVQALQQAIDDVAAMGVVVVVAAGNEYQSAANVSPASCSNVITVAASDKAGQMTAYSNYGSLVDLMAPGGNQFEWPWDGVLSTVKGGYLFKEGTSMSAPHVAGVAALMLAAAESNNSSLSDPNHVESLLKCSAMSADSCSGLCGAGLLDAKRAVELASVYPDMAECEQEVELNPQERQETDSPEEISGSGSLSAESLLVLAALLLVRARRRS